MQVMLRITALKLKEKLLLISRTKDQALHLLSFFLNVKTITNHFVYIRFVAGYRRKKIVSLIAEIGIRNKKTRPHRHGPLVHTAPPH